MRRMLQPVTPRLSQPREERRRVMLPARIRSGCGWSDACILNLSSRGLLVYSKGAAKPGSFVEVRRGGQLVVARVVWRQNQRIGLCTTDPLRVDDIINTEAADSAVHATVRDVRPDRRYVPRLEDQSRAHARAMEFMAILLIVTAMAGTAAVFVAKSLAAPLSTVEQVLKRG